MRGSGIAVKMLFGLEAGALQCSKDSGRVHTGVDTGAGQCIVYGTISVVPCLTLHADVIMIE
jgi:hypothetical protein